MGPLQPTENQLMISQGVMTQGWARDKALQFVQTGRVANCKKKCPSSIA